MNLRLADSLRRFIPVLSLAVATVAFGQVNVLTQRYDNARTSQNLSETILNTSNVNATTFGVLFRSTVDEQIYSQPLYVSSATMGSGPNLVFVTTVNNSVYAFNADTGAQVWTRNLGTAALVSDFVGTGCTDVAGKCGIMGTPVIDASTKKLYVVAKTPNSLPNAQHTLYALDLATGNVLNSVVIAASGSGFTFASRYQQQRPGLLLANNVVYIAFASHCDKPYNNSYQAYLLGYRKTDLVQVSVTNLTPGQQGGIWQAGTGPAADASGNVYVMTANGNRNGTTTWSQSFVKLTPDANGALSIANTTTDTFTPNDYAAMNTADEDLGAAGPLLIPGTNLITGGGKTGELWLLDRSNLGNLQPNDAGAVQRFKAIVQNGSATDHIHGGPIYWNSPANGPVIYVWGESDFGRAYKLVSGTFQTTAFMTTTMRSPSTGTGMPGNMLTVSSNGSSAGTGIVWSNSNLDGNANNQSRPGLLRAFDADNLSAQLWDSETTATPSNDSGYLAKYNYPTVANGKVYFATFGAATSGTGELVVYGLKSAGTQVAAPSFSPAGGTYSTAQSVTISTTTSGATIRYTVDGSTPTSTTGTVYSSAVSISATTTLKAIAYKSGLTDSTVATATYAIGSTTVIEAESLTVAASSGQVWRTSADTNGSGGVIAFFDATAAANYVTLNLSIPAATTYNIKIRYKSGPTRGMFQLAASPTVGGTYTNIGSAQDEYNASQLYNQLADCGSATFATAGSYVFRFTVTGKNAASSGYGLAIDSIELTGSGGGGGTVATPTFSPAGGTYSTAQSVTISTTTSGATIRYTTDGSTPTSTTGTVYSSAVSIAVTTTLKAIAYKSGMTDSGVATATYTISAGGGTTYQAESLTVGANSAGDTVSTISDASLSGGSGRQLAADAATDYVTLVVPAVTAGTYNVFIGVKKSSTEGIFQLATAAGVGGTYFDKGTPQDLYSASAAYTEVSIGAVVFGSTGDKAFRFTVTGKNGTSTDYDLVIDYIRLAP